MWLAHARLRANQTREPKDWNSAKPVLAQAMSGNLRVMTLRGPDNRPTDQSPLVLYTKTGLLSYCCQTADRVQNESPDWRTCFEESVDERCRPGRLCHPENTPFRLVVSSSTFALHCLYWVCFAHATAVSRHKGGIHAARPCNVASDSSMLCVLCLCHRCQEQGHCSQLQELLSCLAAIVHVEHMLENTMNLVRCQRQRCMTERRTHVSESISQCMEACQHLSAGQSQRRREHSEP